jgi:hypothetical protein
MLGAVTGEAASLSSFFSQLPVRRRLLYCAPTSLKNEHVFVARCRFEETASLN